MMNLFNHAPFWGGEGPRAKDYRGRFCTWRPIKEANSGVTRFVQHGKHSISF